LRKATIRFVMSVCPNRTKRLTLDGFSWNFDIWIFFFENLPRKFKFRYYLKIISGTLGEYLYSFFLIMSHSVLRRMRKLFRQICRENQNTCFVFSNSPTPSFENRTVYEIKLINVLEWGRLHLTIWRMRVVCLDTWGYKHTFRICNTFFLKPTTPARRKIHHKGTEALAHRRSGRQTSTQNL
jgi:hypothetical protein